MHAPSSAPSPTKHVATTFTPPVAAQYAAHADTTHTLHVTGGVQTFDESTAVRVDAWQSGLFGCFQSCLNCCMAFCLPCVSLAQISQRIGWGKYWHVLLALLGLYFVEVFVSKFVVYGGYYTYWWDYSAYNPDNFRGEDSSYYSAWSSSSSSSYSGSSLSYHQDATGVYVAAIVAFAIALLLCFCSFLATYGWVTGLVLVFVTWALRSRIRTLFNVPGSCCGDCFASFCCSCCTVAQMATHVKTYKKGNCDFGPVDTLPGFLPQ